MLEEIKDMIKFLDILELKQLQKETAARIANKEQIQVLAKRLNSAK